MNGASKSFQLGYHLLTGRPGVTLTAWLGYPHLREGNGQYTCLSRFDGVGETDMSEENVKATS